ncbi:acyl-CoA dehydrogenase family protein [Bacillus dakarensis]|uniref:acyl-CoA dehydrogenase family protein n=1 Tax=Robertmurraya dakarensis TaxID=1926278 RepID=UPI00098126A1|nr:acyl-CoA dehydrogenase family protein [Bacillus dakarensis]
MNILFTEEHYKLQKMVRDFSKEKVASISQRLEQEAEELKEVFELLSKQGLMGLMLPESFKGTNVDTYSFLITMEEIAKECPPAAFLYNTHLASSFAILAFGNSLQKSEYLPQLAKGNLICALAGTEASGGSSPFAIQTTARKENGSYILNGTKTFISGAGFADLYLVMAKTELEPGKTGLSMFLIEKDTPGFTFGKLEEKLGMQELPTGELLFNECRVPADSLLGPIGGGLQVMGAVGGLAGLGAGAIALGLAQTAADMTKTHLRERTILGQKLGEIGAVQLRFADMMIEAQAARSLLYQAAYDKENSKPGPIPTIFQAKINTTEKALKIIDSAIQLHGMYGYSRDLPLEKLYRDARSLTIHFGNNDVMRSNLSKLMLEI